MNGKMFGTREGFEIFRIIPLQTANERDGDLPSEKRIFAVGFLAAAPARIAKEIDVRRPKREPDITHAVAIVSVGVGIVFCARLSRDNVGDLMKQGRVPGCSQADGLRKNSRGAGPGDAVEAFAPIIVGGHSEPRDRGSAVAQLSHFFRERHPRNQVFNPDVSWEFCIFPQDRSGYDGLFYRGSVFGVHHIGGGEEENSFT